MVQIKFDLELRLCAPKTQTLNLALSPNLLARAGVRVPFAPGSALSGREEPQTSGDEPGDEGTRVTVGLFENTPRAGIFVFCRSMLSFD